MAGHLRIYPSSLQQRAKIMIFRYALFLFLAGACLSWASLPANAAEVDVELVLAAGVSYSMDENELPLQRQGYAEAVSSADFVNAVRDGQIGSVALSYIEWSGQAEQGLVVDWTLINSTTAARAFSREIVRAPVNRGTLTSISAAIVFAAVQFDDNGFEGLRRVIDISGDGKHSDGPPLRAARRGRHRLHDHCEWASDCDR